MDTAVVFTARDPGTSDVMRCLREAYFRVLHRRLEDPAASLASERPDVVVVDVPDDRRVRPLLRPLLGARTLAQTPLIAVVGAAGLSEAASLAGLADLVLRPLRADELVARVRRPLLVAGRDDRDRIRVDRLVVDLKGYEARLDGRPLDLTYQEFELLKFLVSHPDQAFTRDQLLERVWGYDYYGGSRTVDIHVRRIRAKLGHPYSGCIRTMRHVGYKWVPV